MKAFIEINRKSGKGGQIYINDQVKSMNDCHAWFDLNREYLDKVARRKSTESIILYVKEQYNEIFRNTIKP